MKRLTFLLAFAFLFFYGCNKQETNPSAENQQMDATSVPTYVLNLNDENPVWELTTLSDQQSHPGSSTLKQNNSAHAHGEFTGYGGGTHITFSGTQNNGGSHGSAELEQTSGPFYAHIVMETASVVVVGNEAIYGGIITEVLANNFPTPPPPPPGVPAPPCSPYDVGNYIYFKVIDNGQGNNAPLDQYYGIILQSCSEKADGGASFPWFVFGVNDVSNDSDKIKVNN